ncbi:FAD synthetase family protein, partial [bacterium]|nr:FAD synthetase family protein [bacterium]
RGHQKLIDAVLTKRPAMRCAVVTFRDNPKKILHPHTFKGNIFSLGQKIEAFGDAGLDACVLIDFSRNFGKLSGAEFISLLARAGVKFVCVGSNFRCGHKMDTNAQALVELCGSLGIEARIVESVLHGGHPVSSSRIRNDVLEGRLAEAAEMLGRPHIVEVADLERADGGLEALAPAEDAVLPPAGSYLVEIYRDGSRAAMPAKARIGGGRIVLDEGDCRGARRVAIINVVSQE